IARLVIFIFSPTSMPSSALRSLQSPLIPNLSLGTYLLPLTCRFLGFYTLASHLLYLPSLFFFLSPPPNRPPISYPGTSMGFPAPQGHGQDGQDRDLAAGMGRLSMADDIDHHSTGSVDYPKPGQLARHMSSHQRTQGYVPGAWGSPLSPAVPAFALQNEGANANIASVGAASSWQQQGQANAALGAARRGERTGVGHGAIQHPPPNPRAAAAQARADAEHAQAAQSQADRERSERD
ncbi:hypothetical protein DFH09DRAFT_1146436, partial [Mycena vulgaris]